MNPVLNIAAPAHTVSVELQLIVATCILHDFVTVQSLAAPVVINYANTIIPPKDISIPIDIQTGSITIVAGSLRYISANAEIKKMEWTPVGIVDAVCWKG